MTKEEYPIVNNCFEFNLDKTLNASNEQLVAINYILDNYSIDYLDENLKEVIYENHIAKTLAESDYTLNLISDIGEIEINESEFGNHYSVRGNTEKEISITTDIGEIGLSFEK